MFHFFGEAGLLGFEHVGEVVVEFESVGEGEGAGEEVGDEGVAEGEFFVGPAAGAGDGGVVALGGGRGE